MSGPPTLGWKLLRHTIADVGLVEVARRSRVSKQTISALANHRRHIPTLPIALALEDTFAIPARAWTIDRRSDESAIESRPRDVTDVTEEKESGDDAA